MVNWLDEVLEFQLDFENVSEKSVVFWRGKKINVLKESVFVPHNCLLLGY